MLRICVTLVKISQQYYPVYIEHLLKSRLLHGNTCTEPPTIQTKHVVILRGGGEQNENNIHLQKKSCIR